MRRHTIGMIAFVLLVGALGLWLWPQGSAQEALLGALVRVGLLMGAWWLAYPEVERMPPWLLVAIPLLLIVVAYRPKWFLILLPIVIALAVLRPRPQR
jgi:hypothetical protein